MKIIYIFRKNDYAATLAAYLHLKLNISLKDSQKSYEIMKLHYLGIDEKNSEVYLLKYNIKKYILMNIIYGLGNIFNEEVRVIDLSRFDCCLIQILTKFSFKNYKNTLKEYINDENNL